MEIHVYDTYVKAKDGHTMHFDVFTACKRRQESDRVCETMADFDW